MTAFNHSVNVFANLYASIYQLGQSLINTDGGGEITPLLTALHQHLDELSLQQPYKCLQDYLQLDQLNRRILCLNIALAQEPDLLQAFVQLSPYEQGPLMSLERSLILCQGVGQRKSDSLRQYLNSTLHQWQLLTPAVSQCSGRLMQSLIIADGLWEFLHAPEIIKNEALHPLLHHHIGLSEQERIAYRLYEKQLTDASEALLVIDGLEVDERLAFVKAQCCHGYQGSVTAIALYEVSENLESQNGCQLESVNQLKQKLICAYLDARARQQPFYCYWPHFSKNLQQLPQLCAVITALTHLGQAFILLAEIEDYEPKSALMQRVKLRPTLAGERKRCWQQLGLTLNGTLSDPDLSLLAALYPLNGEQMQRVISSLTADPAAMLRTKKTETETQTDKEYPLITRLQQACLTQLNASDGNLAKHCVPRFKLSDMQLTDDNRAQLQNLIARMQYSGEMQDILPHFRPGLQALFWGKSGTGKSMAAEALAKELQLPLYKVNLANIASKWIGESEKQLAMLFDQAEAQNAVLLFDEADAVFSKRSEVESSHDKNANMGVSYLLQRMESYSALLLLSTNFKNNIDTAFLRRFDAVIEFQLPDKRQRQQYWQHLSGYRPGFVEQIDIPGLAELFELTIAQIDNVYQHALLIALQRGGKIQKSHLIEALTRELAKDKASLLCQQRLQSWL